jgi:hypothetical protein
VFARGGDQQMAYSNRLSFLTCLDRVAMIGRPVIS